MNKLLSLLLCLGLLSSCEKKDSAGEAVLAGKWKLIQTLVDPGDGSGKFKNVNSNKIIEFHEDGTVTSNGLICEISVEATEPDSGTYSLVDSTLSPRNCPYSEREIYFDINGPYLLIYYPCDEACISKFKKIEDTE
jgi:hypothetical protein